MDARTYYITFGRDAWHEVCQRAGVHWWQEWAFVAQRQRPRGEVAIQLAKSDPKRRLDPLTMLVAPINRRGVVPRIKTKPRRGRA